MSTAMKWATIVLTFVFAFSMMPGGAGVAFAADLCVHPTGDGGCYTSIQDAIDVANPGDTVLVAAGYYEENLASWKDMEITKSLTLKGAGSGQTIVGLSEGKQNGVEIRGANLDVHLEGITFTKQTGATNGPQRALRIGETASTFNSLTMIDVEVTHAALHNVALDANATITSFTVTDCKFTDAGDSGFYSFAAINGGTFTDNVFDMNGRNDEFGGGIHLAGPTSNLIVTGGSMSNNAHVGFAGRRLTNVTFEDVSANENGPGNPGLLGYQGYGMVINEKHSVSENVTFTNINMIDNRLDGMMLTAESGKEIKNISVIGGTYTGHVRYAIWYWHQTDGLISGVTIDGITTSGNAPIRFHTISDINILNNIVGGGTGFGIDVRYASDVTVSGNDVTGRQAHAVIVQDTSEFEISGNIVHENNVVGIYLQDVTNGQVSGNELFKNNQNEAHAGYTNNPGNLVFRQNSENITVTSNVIRESKRNGIWIHNGSNSNISVNNNNISDNELYQFKNDDAFTVNATCNWWGTTDETEVDASVNGDVTYLPFLVSDDLNNPVCTGGLPYVASITRADASPTSALSVDFTVTFSEDVVGVDVADFSLTTTGVSGAAITGVSGSGDTYTVSVSTGTGSGTIRLDVPETATVEDLLGFQLTGLPFTAGEVYVIDKGEVNIVSITRTGPSPTSAASVDFIVTFSRDVTGVDVSDFVVSHISNVSTLSGTSVTSITGSGNVYTVTVNTGTGNGALRLDVPTTATINDLLANPLSGLPYTDGETYFLARLQTFPDAESDFWAWAFIEQLYAASITSGFLDDTFKPAEAVTRGQMAVFLLKGMNFPAAYTPPQVTEFNFTDIEGHWAADWIEALKASSITGGFPDGTYRPDAPVTRGQMAIFLLKAINGPDYTPPPATPTFDDTAGHWASDWIEALRASGLTGGYPDGTFRPDNPVTRAEMAVFIVNAFELP